jgi:hypothetical protein
MSYSPQSKAEKLLELLNKIQAPATISNSPDPNTQAEEDDLDREAKRLENEHARQHLELRKTFSSRIYILMCVYLGFVALIVLACAGNKCPLKLSDKVLITLLTTTTASVLGLFTIVTRNLFPNK